MQKHVQRLREDVLVIVLAVLCLVLLALLFALWTQNRSLSEQLLLARGESASSTAAYRSIVASKAAQLAQAQSSLAMTSYTLNMTTSALQQEQLKNGEFQTVLNNLQGDVHQIQKTNAVDEELLQKYSKVYFLNENYIPRTLSPIDIKYLYNKDNVFTIHTQVVPFLQRMLETAESHGMHIRIISAYRSFQEQKALKSNYKVTYGSGANAFSADQGYSEHQLGTTIDFTTAELGAAFSSFAKASAYQWLLEHAWEYGFILSYPKGNAYYIYEPWHWRFVGLQLARHLHETGKNFYDLDQREIDTYRGTFFDQ